MHYTALFALLVSLLVSQPAFADDPPPPSLETRSDDLGTPYWAYGVEVDAVGIAFGDYQLGLDLALGRHHGVLVRPGWRRSNGHGPMLGLAYHVWPLGRGLDGLGFGPAFDVAWIRSEDRIEISLGGEVAYRYAWKGLLLGVSAGLAKEWRFSDQRRSGLIPLIRIQLGWAWS